MRFATDALVNDNSQNENSRRGSGDSYVADPNRELFESVVSLLAPLLDELVFVGGCTTGIFITDPAAGGIRPTKDVDAIVDVTSYAKYAALSEKLRVPVGGLRLDELADLLGARGLPADDVTRVRAVLEACDEARFSPGGEPAGRPAQDAMLEKAAALIDTVEKAPLASGGQA